MKVGDLAWVNWDDLEGGRALVLILEGSSVDRFYQHAKEKHFKILFQYSETHENKLVLNWNIKFLSTLDSEEVPRELLK